MGRGSGIHNGKGKGKGRGRGRVKGKRKGTMRRTTLFVTIISWRLLCLRIQAQALESESLRKTFGV
jgi:hypothetical protein